MGPTARSDRVDWLIARVLKKYIQPIVSDLADDVYEINETGPSFDVVIYWPC